jgi:hypothetical protein
MINILLLHHRQLVVCKYQIIDCWPRMFHRNVNNSPTKEEGDADLMWDTAPGTNK